MTLLAPAALLLALPLGPLRDPLWPRCADAVPWFARIDVPNSEARLGELAMSNGFRAYNREWIEAARARTPGVEAWLAEARTRRKPVFWYVPAIEGSHVILPHLADRYFAVGVLSDPLVSALLARRFVAVKCPAAGELASGFDLAAPGFIEPGFLVLSTEGEVVARMDRIYSYQAESLLDPLRALAASLGAEHSEAFRARRAAWDADPGLATGLAFFDEALLDGDLEAAGEVLDALEAGPDDARVQLAAARLALTTRDADGAERALRRARELGAEAAQPDLAAELDLREGYLALRKGELGGAEELLRSALEHGGASAAEAGYWLGAVLWTTRRGDEAESVWAGVADEHPASIFAARADAHARVGADGLPGEAPLTRAMEDLPWAEPATFGTGTRDPRTPAELPDVVDRAVAFLLRQQRAEGAWLGSRWGGDGGDPPLEPVSLGPGLFSNIHTAISALACSALHAWRAVDPEGIEGAVALGEPYLLRDDLVYRGEGSTMWVYADAFRLLHFARRYPDPDARPDEVTLAMQSWIEALCVHQEETGGPFLHYPYESTFVTAMVAICLDEARRVGLDVAPVVFERVADLLENARGGEHDLFGYLSLQPTVNRTLAGAACRQPLCTLALLRCGRTDLSDVERGIELYLDNYADKVEPPRKSNFHMPELDGSAGYFFFHNMLATTLAALEVGRPGRTGRTGHAARLTELLCELPEVDGAFVDSGFSYGKAYGTAVALLCLAELLDR